MVGSYIFTQRDRQFNTSKPDSIGIPSPLPCFALLLSFL
jgi:hypothetical protein